MPLYLKSHSYGEYVFDWSWADAWRRSGLDYYPKLVTAMPFTPATGPRLCTAPGTMPSECLDIALQAIQTLSEQTDISPPGTCCFPRKRSARNYWQPGCTARRNPVPLVQRWLQQLRRFSGHLQQPQTQITETRTHTRGGARADAGNTYRAATSARKSGSSFTISTN